MVPGPGLRRDRRKIVAMRSQSFGTSSCITMRRSIEQSSVLDLRSHDRAGTRRDRDRCETGLRSRAIASIAILPILTEREAPLVAQREDVGPSVEVLSPLSSATALRPTEVLLHRHRLTRCTTEKRRQVRTRAQIRVVSWRRRLPTAGREGWSPARRAQKSCSAAGVTAGSRPRLVARSAACCSRRPAASQ